MMKAIAAMLLAALLAVAPVALAQDDEGGSYDPRRGDSAKIAELTLDRPWARPTLGRAPNSAAFLRVRNDGVADDLLIEAKSPVAERVEIHTHRMDDGVMRMRRVEAVEIPSGTMVEFAPGGLHVMLIGLKRRLEAGSYFPLTLVFRDAGEVTLRVGVSMRAPTHGAGHEMEHGHRAGDPES